MSIRTSPVEHSTKENLGFTEQTEKNTGMIIKMNETSSKPSERLFGIGAFECAGRLGSGLGLCGFCRCHNGGGTAGGRRLFPPFSEKMGVLVGALTKVGLGGSITQSQIMRSAAAGMSCTSLLGVTWGMCKGSPAGKDSIALKRPTARSVS